MPARIKEIQYFSSRYWPNLDDLYYRTFFPTFVTMYNGRITGEAGNNYLWFPMSPGRMKQLLPDAKIIVSLRNPTDRAYSHYKDQVRSKQEKASSFEAALESKKNFWFDEKNIIKNWYYEIGYYAKHLENWFGYYKRDRFLILEMDDFIQNTATQDRIFEFLGLEPIKLDMPKSNIGKYEPMSTETRRMLVEHYKPHNKRLYKLLGCEFDWDR